MIELVTVVFGSMALFLVIVVSAVSMFILRGWALSQLWAWFVVPLGLPPLGIAHAIGVSVLVSFLVGDTRDLVEKEREGKEKWEVLAIKILNPLLTIGIGWIVNQFYTGAW